MQEMKALFGKAASLVQQLLLEGTCISEGNGFWLSILTQIPRQTY